MTCYAFKISLYMYSFFESKFQEAVTSQINEWKYINMSRTYAIIGWDHGLSPVRHQAIIWTNAVLLSIKPLRINFTQIVFKI